MGTPKNDHDRYFATYDFAGLQIHYDMIQRFHPKTTTVLDVGAGWGKYCELMPEYRHMDACEIWRPNIEDQQLDQRYRHVFEADITDLDIEPYDVIIMGDVLEHLPVDAAVATVARLSASCEEIYVAVPYLHPQGEVDGNPFETHHQDDLTDDVVIERYPTLKLYAASPDKGVYVKRRTP